MSKWTSALVVLLIRATRGILPLFPAPPPCIVDAGGGRREAWAREYKFILLL